MDLVELKRGLGRRERESEDSQRSVDGEGRRGRLEADDRRSDRELERFRRERA